MELDVLFEKAQAAYKTGELHEAIHYYETIYQMHPSSDLAIEIALLYDEADDLKNTKHYYEQALTLNINNERAYYGIATVLEREERMEEAISYYKEAVLLKPDFAPAHFFLANAYDTIGEINLAIYHYEEVIEIDPDYFFAYLNLGSIYEGLNQNNRALDLFKQAETIRSDHHLLHFNYGVIYQKLGDYEKSKYHYEHSITISNAYPYVYLNLAILYKDYFQDLDEAIRIYSEGITHHPDVSVLYYNRGCALALQKQWKQSVDDFEEAIHLSPSLYDEMMKDIELVELRKTALFNSTFLVD